MLILFHIYKLQCIDKYFDFKYIIDLGLYNLVKLKIINLFVVFPTYLDLTG